MDNPSPIDMLNIIQRMAREAFGGDVPPEVLARLISEMTGEMGMGGMGPGMFGGMPGVFIDDEEDDFDEAFEAILIPHLPKNLAAKSLLKSVNHKIHKILSYARPLRSPWDCVRRNSR